MAVAITDADALVARPDPGWEVAGWRNDAACRDLDANLFFPAGETGPAAEQIEQAKSICAQCPVVTQCLEFAMATHQDYGVWGGLTEEERREIRRAWRRRGAMRAS